MILFPNAKINLGLRVLRRRPDGYHDLMTVMMPLGWEDILEIVPSRSGQTVLSVTGPAAVDCPAEQNLVMKALRAVETDLGRTLPPVEIYLDKRIPSGAGLGGGSADAAFAVLGLNEVLGLGLTHERMSRIAARVGADCPFFILNRPALCTGTGTTIAEDVHIDFSRYLLAVAKPRTASVSTARAYAGISPCGEAASPTEVLALDVSLWQELLVNDFEASVFPEFPEIAAVKDAFRRAGALYAAMSGSGAAVFGIFEDDKLAQYALDTLTDCDTCLARGRAW